MKKLGTLLVFLSVSLFVIGCNGKTPAKTPSKTEPPKTEKTETPPKTETPAKPEAPEES